MNKKEKNHSSAKFPTLKYIAEYVCARVVSFLSVPILHIFPPKKRIVVYTCIFGKTDILKEPLAHHKGVDFVCFTDDPDLVSDVWQIRKVSLIDDEPVLTSKYYKMHPHLLFKEYDYSIWADATHALRTYAGWAIRKYLKNADLAVFDHPFRNTLSEEAKRCIKVRLDVPERINVQIDRYKAEGYPDNEWLATSTVLFRRHNSPLLVKTMDDWYGEVLANSIRDQLSFNYVTWKNDLNYTVIKGYGCRNPYFRYNPHLKRGIIKRVQQYSAGR